MKIDLQTVKKECSNNKRDIQNVTQQQRKFANEINDMKKDIQKLSDENERIALDVEH